MYCYLPEIIVFITALTGVLYSLRETVYFPIFIRIGALAALGSCAALWALDLRHDSELYKVDHFALFGKIVILGFYCCIDLLNKHAAKPSDLLKPEFSILLLLSVLGTMVMLSAQDFLTLFLGIELQTFPFYIMIGICRNSKENNEAALKYFILGIIASAFYLYGTSLIYGMNGSIKFSEFNDIFIEIPLILIAVYLVCSSFFFKLSMAPFHMWAPDIYQGTPSSTTLLIASLPKIGFLMVLVRLIAGPFYAFSDALQNLFMLIGSLSLMWGALGALAQSSFKRLLAYSTISHMGYICLGLSVSEDTAFGNVLIYILMYGVSIVGVFGILFRLGNLAEDPRVDSFAGLSKTNPGLAFAFSVFLLSMAGIPPFAGFFTKFSLFFTAISAGLYWFVGVGALATLIGAYYYLRMIKIMYFDEKDPSNGPFNTLSTPFQPVSMFCASNVIIYSSMAITLLFFYFMPTLAHFVKQMASNLFIGSIV